VKLLLTLFCWLVLTSALAQTGTVRGRITDTAQEPQVGLVVRLENTAFGTTTDADGAFFLGNIAPGQYTLVVAGMGYAAEKRTVAVQASQTTRLQLALDPKQQELQEVVVTDRRTFETSAAGATRTATPIKDLPQSVQVINQSTLQQQQVYRVDEALKNVAGVNESSAWGSYNFRGFDTNAMGFLTNGQKGTGYPEGVSPFLANVERVEVLRGPAAILYGEGAVGGNINLITKQPRKNTAVNARLSGGSFGLFRGQADVAGSLTANKRLYGIAGVGYENGGQFTQDFRHRTTQLFGSLRWEPGVNTTWQVNATYNRDRSTRSLAQDVPMYPGQLFSVPDNFRISSDDAYYRGDSYQLQSQLRQRFSERWSGHLWLGYAQSRAADASYAIRNALDSLGTFARTRTQQVRRSPSRTLNAFVNGRFELGSTTHQLTAGVDLLAENANYPEGIRRWLASSLNVGAPNYAAFDETQTPLRYYSRQEQFTTRTTGAYVQDQVALSPRFKALLGLRYNHYHYRYTADDLSYDNRQTFEQYAETPDNTTALIPRVGVVYQPNATNSFYVDYNVGFVPQYSNSAAYGGPFDPERTRQVEVGWKGDFLDHRLVPTVAVYQILKRNVLTLDQDSLAAGSYLYRPVGGVRSRGVEATLTGTVLPGWKVILNYSYNQTKVTDSSDPAEIGQQFANSPRHLASSWTTYEPGRRSLLRGLLLGAGFRFTGDRYAALRPADTEVLVLPGYGVLDVVVGYAYRQFSVQLNGNNLLGKRYARSSYWDQSYFPGTPRNLLVTLGYSL
jgi:iron complex outermembrane receptor protein